MSRAIKAAVVAFAFASQAWGDEAEAKRGKVVYETWCIACHAAGNGQPGTQALKVRYEGKLPAVLDERTDLAPPMTRNAVRKGVSIMPFFRKTEISDRDLEALAAYLARVRTPQP